MSVKPSRIDRIFHALGDPTRRAIIERISDKPVSVSSLAKPLKISLAAVVQQLQILEGSGLIRTRKIGRVRTCSIEPGGLSLAGKWIAERKALWEMRLDKLGEILREGD
ncbi:MAG: metalloregulator ArsR/SmtB family transcription factor [Spirochaetia bacterium]|nr:metalloregulator ArsR/SmtB family transcription factor [Spirochaetia bacterium]